MSGPPSPPGAPFAELPPEVRAMVRGRMSPTSARRYGETSRQARAEEERQRKAFAAFFAERAADLPYHPFPWDVALRARAAVEAGRDADLSDEEATIFNRAVAYPDAVGYKLGGGDRVFSPRYLDDYLFWLAPLRAHPWEMVFDYIELRGEQAPRPSINALAQDVIARFGGSLRAPTREEELAAVMRDAFRGSEKDEASFAGAAFFAVLERFFPPDAIVRAHLLSFGAETAFDVFGRIARRVTVAAK